MSVNYVRKELQAVAKIYSMIRDCIAGQFAIKAKGQTYLPKPNAEDFSPENEARYDAYIERSVFYNVTARTLRGLVGQVFLRYYLGFGLVDFSIEILLLNTQLIQ